MKIKQLLACFATVAFAATSANAALTAWDFTADNDNGWTAVKGEAFLADNGVTAAQADGEGIDGFFGNVNATGASRNGHDGAHSSLLFRSPVINFGSVPATGAVLEIDWVGGGGKQQADLLDPTSPDNILDGSTSGLQDGLKGLALFNLTTGNYDAISYRDGNGGDTQTASFDMATLTAAGVSSTDDYQLDFFETDDGSWGWTRLQGVRVDDAAITGVDPPRNPNIVVSNDTFLRSATQGSQVGTLRTISGTPGDSYTYSLVAGEGSTDNAKFQIGGGELQIGPYNFSTTAENTRFSVRVRATGTPSGEQIEKAVLVTALTEPPPPEGNLVWDFSPGNEHGWTTVSGASFIADNGITAGQADGEGIDGFFGNVNNSGALRNGHDGAHTNFIYRSPVINFGFVSTEGAVLEVDFVGGGQSQGELIPTGPAEIIGNTTGGNQDGFKGLGLLNLSTGNYDVVSYREGNGGDRQTASFTLDDLTAAGVTTTDNYQLDFFETDDGSWGWTRLEGVRLDPLALGETSQSFAITNIDYSPADQLLTLTWNSREGQTYAVKYSEDMKDWSADLDDAVEADAGDQTTKTFDLAGTELTDVGKVFFRVER